ncbi:MAG: hypothetical protein MUF12_00660 [Sediminibacterium sp.]|jgi:cell division septum initiation protein DivIVA|nr:hypothetical protein [Sediminibacterium sp.]
METLKRWVSPQNISVVAVICFIGLILTSYFRQTKPIKDLEQQVKESKAKVAQQHKKVDSLSQNSTINEKQRIEDNYRVDILPDPELQNAIDSAFIRP